MHIERDRYIMLHIVSLILITQKMREKIIKYRQRKKKEGKNRKEKERRKKGKEREKGRKEES